MPCSGLCSRKHQPTYANKPPIRIRQTRIIGDVSAELLEHTAPLNMNENAPNGYAYATRSTGGATTPPSREARRNAPRERRRGGCSFRVPRPTTLTNSEPPHLRRALGSRGTTSVTTGNGAGGRSCTMRTFPRLWCPYVHVEGAPGERPSELTRGPPRYSRVVKVPRQTTKLLR